MKYTHFLWSFESVKRPMKAPQSLAIYIFSASRIPSTVQFFDLSKSTPSAATKNNNNASTRSNGDSTPTFHVESASLRPTSVRRSVAYQLFRRASSRTSQPSLFFMPLWRRLRQPHRRRGTDVLEKHMRDCNLAFPGLLAEWALRSTTVLGVETGGYEGATLSAWFSPQCHLPPTKLSDKWTARESPICLFACPRFGRLAISNMFDAVLALQLEPAAVQDLFNNEEQRRHRWIWSSP